MTATRRALLVLATTLAAAAPVSAIVSADPDVPAAAEPACHTVAQVGDSTSLAGINTQLVPDEHERTEGAYHDIAGVDHTWIDALAGRTTVDPANNGTNGVDALTTLTTHNPDCYVLAVGTNDAGYVAMGSAVPAAERIDRMMALTAGKPVLWPTVVTLPTETADGYQPESMRAFNAALVDATNRYPTLHVYDWAALAEANPELFYEDGIHPNPDGARLRNRKFAEQLAHLPTAPAVIRDSDEKLGNVTATVNPEPAE